MEDPPRTLTEWLRARDRRDDGALARLLTLRPELMRPVPSDLGTLASQVASRGAVLAALDRIDAFTLQVVDVLVALPEPVSFADLADQFDGDPAVREALERLRDLALVWGDDDALHLLQTARQMITNPAGLGPPLGPLLELVTKPRLDVLLADLGLPPAASAAKGRASVVRHVSDPAWLRKLLKRAPAGAQKVLDLLTWGPPIGHVEEAMREVDADRADTPVSWLLAHGLLAALDPSTVVLPREVAIALRGGRVTSAVASSPPAMEVTEHPPSAVDSTGAAQAFAFVRRVEELLEWWGVDPPGVLRAGGLGVRDVRAAARRLDIDEQGATLTVEVAAAAGLLWRDGDHDQWWLPTAAYDTWLARPTEGRWVRLAEAWLAMARVPGLVGRRPEPSDGATGIGLAKSRDKAPNALGFDAERPVAPVIRSGVLEALAGLPPGGAAAAESVRAVLGWRWPRRAGRLCDLLVDTTLAEAELLGVTGRGALTSFGRLLVSGDQSAASALGPLLPKPVDHVLVQADLTAVAPGPLDMSLARRLAAVADVESRGGATVYRFTEASVRRGLDAGLSASDVHELLVKHSRTPVPQPLSYLIDDVARRHGRIRVGAAGSYARCDDEAVLAEVLADRRADDLGLRRLAPGVVVSAVPAKQLLERLRALRYAPAAEAPDGAIVIRQPGARRADPRPRFAIATPTAPVEPAVVDAAVRALRAGDRAATARRPGPESPAGVLVRTPSDVTLAMLHDAVSTGQSLLIGYVNAQGLASNRIIEPRDVSGGYVTAYDHRRAETRTFAVHRITGIATVPTAPGQ